MSDPDPQPEMVTCPACGAPPRRTCLPIDGQDHPMVLFHEARLALAEGRDPVPGAPGLLPAPVQIERVD